MRYWRLKDTLRVIRTGNIFMNPNRWEEITKEEFQDARDFQEKIKNLGTGRINSS